VQSSDEIGDDHTSTVPDSSVSSDEPLKSTEPTKPRTGDTAGVASTGGDVVSGYPVPDADPAVAVAGAARGLEPTTEAREPTTAAAESADGDGDGEARRFLPLVPAAPAPAGAESVDAAAKLRERVASVPEPAGRARVDNVQRSERSSTPEQARSSAPEQPRGNAEPMRGASSEQPRGSASEPARRMMPSPQTYVPAPYVEPRRRVQVDRAERVELARTLPDIRTPTPSRPRAILAGQQPRQDTLPGPQEFNPDARLTPQADGSSGAPARSTRDADFGVESMGPMAHGQQPRRTLRQGPGVPGMPSAGLGTPDQGRMGGGGGYEPSHHTDPAAFERLMRERAAARSMPPPPPTRPYWNQQDTLLIPRDAFDLPKLPVRGWPWALSIGLATCLGFFSFLLLRDSEREIDVNPFQYGAVASVGVTVISTEPAGAELLQSGAVIGNTPISVSRPRHGEALYIIRMYGFAPELVRVTSESAATIRVTLTPVAAFGSVSAAK
jgi:hypothetical protein